MNGTTPPPWIYYVPLMYSILHASDLSPTSDLYNPLLPDITPPDVRSDCSIYNLSLKVRCETRHLCQCTEFLRTVRSFVSYLSSSLAWSRGGPEGSVGKSIPVAFIFKCVDVLILILVLHTWRREGSCVLDFFCFYFNMSACTSLRLFVIAPYFMFYVIDCV